MIDLRSLNEAYLALEARASRLLALLSPEARLRWYNGHYHRTVSGDWEREAYPIPVIELRGLCDIELQFSSTIVTSKLKREAALMLDFPPFASYPFEVSGVEDYLTDLCLPGQTEVSFRQALLDSTEQEVFFSFQLQQETDAPQFLMLLRSHSFYY